MNKLLLGFLHAILFLVLLGFYLNFIPPWHKYLTIPTVEFLLNFEEMPWQVWVINSVYIILFSIDLIIPSVLSAVALLHLSKLRMARIGPVSSLAIIFCTLLVVVYEHFTEFIPRFSGINLEYIWYVFIPGLVLYWIHKKPPNAGHQASVS